MEQVLGFQPSFPNSVDNGDIPFQQLSMVPIERGGRFGISGNGHVQMQIRNMVKAAEDRATETDAEYIQKVLGLSFEYFYCLDCKSPI